MKKDLRKWHSLNEIPYLCREEEKGNLTQTTNKDENTKDNSTGACRLSVGKHHESTSLHQPIPRETAKAGSQMGKKGRVDKDKDIVWTDLAGRLPTAFVVVRALKEK